jgi:hypothetical protein
MSSPSIVPHQFQFDRDVYLVMDDLGGQFGCIWRETSAQAADPGTILADMLDGQYSNPVQVVAFNTLEHWSRDVSENVAHELRRRCDQEGRELPSCLRDFVERLERGHHRT